MATRRGQCPVCRFRWRLRKDGTLQAHYGYTGSVKQPMCAGSGKPPRPLGFDGSGRPDCGDCLMYLHGPQAAMLAEAVYSVSIENGRSPGQMLRDYLTAYHERDHQEMA